MCMAVGLHTDPRLMPSLCPYRSMPGEWDFSDAARSNKTLLVTGADRPHSIEPASLRIPLGLPYVQRRISPALRGKCVA
jgi:hypothetical protein